MLPRAMLYAIIPSQGGLSEESTMPTSDLVRWSGLAAMLAVVAFIVDILFVFTMPEADWTNAGYIVAALLMVVGLLGLHALQKDSYGRVGRGVFSASVGPHSLPAGERCSHLACVPGGLLGRTRRAHRLWSGHLASEGATALVRVGTHHYPADNDSLGRLRRNPIRASVAGAGVCALVVERYSVRATVAGALSGACRYLAGILLTAGSVREG